MTARATATLLVAAAAGGCVGWDEPPPPITRDQLNESVVLAATAPGLERGRVLTHGSGGGPNGGSAIESNREDRLVAGADPLEVLVALLADAHSPTVAWHKIRCDAHGVSSVSGSELIHGAVVSVDVYVHPEERDTGVVHQVRGVRVKVWVSSDSTTSDTLPRKDVLIGDECDAATLETLAPVTGIEPP